MTPAPAIIANPVPVINNVIVNRRQQNRIATGRVLGARTEFIIRQVCHIVRVPEQKKYLLKLW